jgi:xylulokinase
MALHTIGIDVGTSAVKALLVDDGQRVLAQAEAPLEVSRPQPLWSEQDPESWWLAVDRAVRALRAHAPDSFQHVEAIGLSGQMHGAVLLDERDRVLRPAILWNDGRAHAECEALKRAVPDLAAIAGVPAMPGFTAPKLLWVARHEPDTFAKTRSVLLPKDYVRLRMTGEKITDASDAAGTLWLDQRTRAWSPALLEASGCQPSQMPRVIEGCDIGGHLLADVARGWGLRAGLPIAGGAGDAAAGAVGIGAIADGDAFVSLGTSAQYFVSGDRYRPWPHGLVHAFCHALPGRWFQMGAMLNGASALAWAAQLFGEGDIGALLDRVEQAYRGPARVLFLPYLTGERTPLNDPHARGVFFGMHADTTREELVQAVLEGVAFSIAQAQDLLAQAGTSPTRVAVIGGGSRSRFWMQMLATVLGRPVDRYRAAAQGPALGAARLAQLTCGEDAASICRKPPLLETLAPDLALGAGYQECARRHRELYPALRAHFPR